MAAKRRTAKRMESQSMGAASRRMSRSQAKERRHDEKRERKMKCQVSRRSSPTFSPTWETEFVKEVTSKMPLASPSFWSRDYLSET